MAFPVAVGALLTCCAPIASYGQSKCSSVTPVTVSGIGMAITRTAVQRDLLVQFIVTNKTTGPIYIKSAQWDESAKASLESGTEIFRPVASGIETTQGGSANGCLGNPTCSQDLSTFTRIDPRKSIKFGYKYSSMVPMRESDSISLSVNLITRFGGKGSDEGDAGQGRVIGFHFNSIPLGC